MLGFPGCQICDNTADHVVTFTAPATATYRFFASSGGDVELAVYPGDCTATPNNVACGEDIDLPGEDYDDQVDVDLARGATVTVVVGRGDRRRRDAGDPGRPLTLVSQMRLNPALQGPEADVTERESCVFPKRNLHRCPRGRAGELGLNCAMSAREHHGPLGAPALDDAPANEAEQVIQL